MPSNKTTDFAGHDFYVGLDVHKKSWTVTVRTLDLEVAHFTQTPDADLLARQLHNKYPQGHFYSAYEAGFCGTTPHVDLQKAGFENIIIHAADLPQTDKQRKNKTDLHDSRAIARYLERGLLKSIHIMPVHLQEQRALFRCRQAKVKDVTRCINRLRSMLIFFGIDVPLEFRDKEYISKNFVNWLNKAQLQTQQGTEVLRQDINDLIYHRQQLLLITRKLRNAIIAQYKQSYYSMLTVPGIGSITAMALLAETGDLNRFKNPDEFASYLGLIPGEHSSGETLHHINIQPRCNTHLRPLLIEAAWQAIRKCPVLLAYYKKHAGKNSKKGIIKVARKLALIAKAVSLKQSSYQANSKEK